MAHKKFEYKNGIFLKAEKSGEKVLKKWHTYIWKGTDKQFIPFLKDETDPNITKNYIHWNQCSQCRAERVYK